MVINRIPKFLEKICGIKINVLKSLANIQHIGISANTAFNLYNFRLGLIKALQNAGYKVFAIAPYDEYADKLIAEDIPFIEVKQLARKGTNPFQDFLLMNEYRKIFKKNKIDIVLQYTIKPNIYGTLAAVFTNTKTICTVTGLGYTFLNDSLSNKIAHRLYKLSFGKANIVLFQNADDLQLFLEKGLVQKDKAGVVNGSGIDTDYFYPEFCKDKINNEQQKQTAFLMVARLLKDKGVYEYITAATKILSENKNAVFHLLGALDDGNPAAIKKQELEDWINSGIIIYHPHTHDIRSYYCDADCVVLPSYREGMPRVLLEAMAMGKPCITTDAPGCKDAVVEDNTGFICNTADSVSLASCMRNFINLNIEYKNQLGINARKRAINEYSITHIVKFYFDLIKKV